MTIAELHLAVPYATWTAFYDIRVNMDTKENPVTLIYKAAVKQSTGEVCMQPLISSRIAEQLVSSLGTTFRCSSRRPPQRLASAYLRSLRGISMSIARLREPISSRLCRRRRHQLRWPEHVCAVSVWQSKIQKKSL
jgi:hypothetical protein